MIWHFSLPPRRPTMEYDLSFRINHWLFPSFYFVFHHVGSRIKLLFVFKSTSWTDKQTLSRIRILTPIRNESEIDFIRRISKLLDGQGCKSDAGGYVTWSLDQLGMICGCAAASSEHCLYILGTQGTQGDTTHACTRKKDISGTELKMQFLILVYLEQDGQTFHRRYQNTNDTISNNLNEWITHWGKTRFFVHLLNLDRKGKLF